MISQERLKQVLDYDPATGVFTWKARSSNRIEVGKRAGGFGTYGYRLIGIDGKLFHASRLAWLYVTGEWPELHIDHANGNRDDDRFANLRHATRSENQCNRAKQANNTSGFKGVYFCKVRQMWRARITFRGSTEDLGLHETAEQAGTAYALAAKRVHGEFARV